MNQKKLVDMTDKEISERLESMGLGNYFAESKPKDD